MSDSNSALEFKSATLYAIRAVLHSNDIEQLSQDLAKRMREAASLFAGESFVIDASNVGPELDWDALLNLFSDYKLPVIGFVAPDEKAQGALDAGLAKVELSGSAPRATTHAKPASEVVESMSASTPVPSGHTAPSKPKAATVQPAAQPVAKAATQVVQGPLRSGQRVYARGADLIVMGLVSQGAEVMADGNVHVYGPLRGKAMAGARGDSQARIYTTCLDAELVAVAGIYRVIEGPLSADLQRKPAMIYLRDDTLRMDPLHD